MGHGEPPPSPGDAGHRRHATVPGVGPNRGDPGMTHGAAFWFHCVCGRASVDRTCGLPQLRQMLARRAAAVVGAGRRSSRCPIARTCASGSRPPTAPRAPRVADVSAISNGAAPDRAERRVNSRSKRRNRPIVAGTISLAREVITVARALLLNASFEPLCVVSSRRAVVLVLKEKAEIVHRNGAEFRSERRNVPVPTVIRLVHFVRVPFRATAPAFAPRRVRTRRPPVSVLRHRGREPRPRPAPLPRRTAHVGERRRVVPVVQRTQGGPAPERVRDGVAPATGRAARDHVADRVGRPDRSGVAQVPRLGRGCLGLSRRLDPVVGVGFVGAASRSSSTASSSRARWRSRLRLVADLGRIALGGAALPPRLRFSAAWRRAAASCSASSQQAGDVALGGIALPRPRRAARRRVRSPRRVRPRCGARRPAARPRPGCRPPALRPGPAGRTA